jgi:sugar-specific transcriptional regulator TrmB
MDEGPARGRAIETLEAVGLTTYEATVFVALSRIPSGTAKDVSDIADVPRTRVYDLAEQLQDRGLVEIRDGSPREFRAVSTDEAVAILERSFTADLEAAASALREVSTPDEDAGGPGVWSITGQEAVIERGQYVAARAEEELFGLFTDEAVFRENCFRQAEHALERGVRVVLGSPDAGLRRDLEARFPDAVVWEPSLDWATLPVEDGQVTRLVMADRSLVMLATRSGDGSDTASEETAIWGEGPNSEMVLLMRQLLGPKLDALARGEDPATPSL